MGGYVSGPVLRQAQKMGIPTAIHEQNAYPGVANKAVAKNADCLMLTVEKAARRFKSKAPFVNTGLPIRSDLLNVSREESRAKLGLEDRPLVLSMGGSLGAQAVNEAVLALIAARYTPADIYFVHATGRNTQAFLEKLKALGVDPEKEKNVHIREYIDDMATYLNAADLVISRAGASSLSEIQALGKASILIPSPNVAENHQFHNAMALVEKDAAFMIEEKDLSGESLIKAVDNLLKDQEKRKQLGLNAKGMAVYDSSERIYDCIVSLVNKN